MKLHQLTIISFIIFQVFLHAQSRLMDYYSINQLGFTSPGAMKYGLYGYDNPAMLSTESGPDFYFTWSDNTGTWNNYDNWGLFASIPHIGFAVVNSKLFGASINNYKLSASLGDDAFSYGLGYSWNTGNEGAFNASNLYTLGTLIRPDKFLSLGLIGNLPTSGRSEGVVDLAIRPLGDEFISLFGDYSIEKDMYAGLSIKLRSASNAFEKQPCRNDVTFPRQFLLRLEFTPDHTSLQAAHLQKHAFVNLRACRNPRPARQIPPFQHKPSALHSPF